MVCLDASCRVPTLLPLPTPNRPAGPICKAKRLFLAYFGPVLVPLGSHLGHFESGKWAKMLRLDVLFALPNSVQPNSLNRGSHMALIVKMAILTLFWAVLGPFEVLNM